ncbi:unnamed protein product [Microthlaspi erraticum]|uniref:Uncharacterized protein n=1 Tax=Microthlaspi erraticum TaxID=1685480 RepID=A0A6D2L9I2_9BRAS|nr:unnamed protein product [Microthlaspi erraticum]
MVLSKRWQPLWKLVPKLVYDDEGYQNIVYGKFSRFVDRSLILHEAPIQALDFKLVQTSGAADIGIWTAIAVKRCVRELSIESSPSTTPVTLPRSLYTGCTTLVTLKLKSVTLVDVSSLPSFPTLKTLSLICVKYPGDEFVKSLLSNCHVLQDLEVERFDNDDVTVFTIVMPSLKSLHFIGDEEKDGEAGLVIDAPLVENMYIHNVVSGFSVIKNDMPKIVKARIVVSNSHPGTILGYITSVKRLRLCLFSTSKEVHPAGTDFQYLVNFHPIPDQTRPCWIEPSSIPECLLSSLETLKWEKYEGREE